MDKKKKFNRAELELKSVGMKAQKQMATKPMKAQEQMTTKSPLKNYGEDTVFSTDTDKQYYDGPSANNKGNNPTPSADQIDELTRKAIQDTTQRARRMRKNKDFSKKLEIREGY